MRYDCRLLSSLLEATMVPILEVMVALARVVVRGGGRSRGRERLVGAIAGLDDQGG